MLDENNLFQRAATSAYASMAAFTAAANMYNSFYPPTNSNTDPVNYFGCTGKIERRSSSGSRTMARARAIVEMKRERLDPKIRVKLEDMDLWTSFSSLGNEMIITK